MHDNSILGRTKDAHNNHGKSEHGKVYHTQTFICLHKHFSLSLQFITRVYQMQSLGGRNTWRSGKPGSPLPCEAPLHSHPEKLRGEGEVFLPDLSHVNSVDLSSNL